ncbi:MAG: hypothetical protein ACLTLM_12795 [Oscillospiraceae bacterium]
MLNFDKKDAHVYPFDESPGAGIIMDVDLEQLIRESERLRICKAILHSKNQRDALEAVLTEPNASPAGEDIPDPRVPPEEADHA